MTNFSKILLVAVAAAVALVAAGWIWKSKMPSDPIYSASFDADDRYFSLTFRVGGGKLGSLVYDADTQQFYSIQSKIPSVHFGVRSQKLSKLRPGQIYVTRYEAQLLKNVRPGGEAARKLYRCDLAVQSCTEVFSSKMNISYPIELGNGELLFVGSKPNHHPYKKDENSFLGYTSHDFYYRTRNGSVHRLTEGDFYQLASVSLAKRALYFTGFGGYEQLVKKQGGSKLFWKSDILRLPFDASHHKVHVSERDVLPYFYGGSEYDTKPAISDAANYFAYLGGTHIEGRSGYYYKLFVEELNTGDVVFEAMPRDNQSFYGPAIVGAHTVRFAENYDGVLYFFEADLLSGQSKQVASIELSALASPENEFVVTIYVEDLNG